MEGCLYQGLRKLISLRKENNAFSGGQLEIIWTWNDHVLGYRRIHNGEHAIVFANFSETRQAIPFQAIELYAAQMHKRLYGGSQVAPGKGFILEPLDFLVLA